MFSLLGFALTINASILTVAGAAFFYGRSGEDTSDASLEGAHHLIKSFLGNGAAIIFALALLCVCPDHLCPFDELIAGQAGQSASITATLAGQVVSEGFIEWRTSVHISLTIHIHMLMTLSHWFDVLSPD